MYIDPIGFYDLDMNYHKWNDSYNSQMPYSQMVKILKGTHFYTEKPPILWQVNLKLTKEFGKGNRLSFFTNNLFDYRPLFFNERTGSSRRLNERLYFGAELKLSI